MQLLSITHSACERCRTIVPAKVVAEDGRVAMRTFCPEHGESTETLSGDLDAYLSAQRYVKPAWVPRAHATERTDGCASDCGMCDQHEQHLCLPIVEITERCDMRCPACLVDAGGTRDLSLEEFRAMLDGLVRAEGRIDVLNLSGGEPTVHPEFLAFVDEALGREEIVRLSVSTNGRSLLRDPDLCRRLKERNVVVSLQFDGLDDDAYVTLRGEPLADEKRRILDVLCEADVSTSLTMTAAGGVNDDQFGTVLDALFSRENVVSLMVQPLAFAGRGVNLRGVATRLSIPDVIRGLAEAEAEAEAEAGAGAGGGRVAAEDFVPLPCSHPLCFSLSFYLMLDCGTPVPVNRLAKADVFLDSVKNKIVFGLDQKEHEQLKEFIYELWSQPAGNIPDSDAVLSTLRGIMRQMSCSCFDPRKAFTIAERRVKSIFIHAFQDAGTFDLARARRCCNGYPQRDGRVIPACMRNVLGAGR